jgi:hypothetical protein
MRCLSRRACASIIDDDELLIGGGASATDTHLVAMARATDDAELLTYIEHRRRWAF